MGKESKNVLIIGNGFDLHHGMLTKYSDMIQFYISLRDQVQEYEFDSTIIEKVSQWVNNSFFDYFVSEYECLKEVRNWIDMEHGVKLYIETMLSFFTEQNNRGTGGQEKQAIDLSIQTEEVQLMLVNAHAIGDFKNMKFRLSPRFITFQGLYDIEEMTNAFADELEGLEKIVTFYLKEIEPVIRPQERYQYYNQIKEINPNQIICFNYTDTVCSIYKQAEKNITYIHGNLKEENVVLGYEDLNERTDDIVFKKYYRRFIKKTDSINYSKFSWQDKYGNDIKRKVYYFGHSLDISDEDILKPILTDYDAVIFYRDENEYAKKIKNLFLMLDKQVVIDKMNDGTISFERIES